MTTKRAKVKMPKEEERTEKDKNSKKRKVIRKAKARAGTKAIEDRHQTSGAFHALNGCPLFNSSRTQKIISLSSCEAELRDCTSFLSFRWHAYIYIYVYMYVEGKVRHLDGKLLWVQNRKDFTVVQVPTDSNVADIDTNHLARGSGS